MSLLKKPVFWVSAIGLCAVGYFYGQPEAETSGIAVKTAKKKSSSKNKTEQYLPEDFKASFAVSNTPVRNSFVPVVARRTNATSADSIAPNVVPAEFTGGEAGWIYTGNAEIDGRPVALLENRSTGDGIFLRRGETWKKCRVISIGEDSVIMRGAEFTQTFSLVDETMTTTTTARLNPMSVQVPSNFRGRIGGNQFGGNTPMMMPGGGSTAMSGGFSPMGQLPQVAPDPIVMESP